MPDYQGGPPDPSLIFPPTDPGDMADDPDDGFVPPIALDLADVPGDDVLPPIAPPTAEEEAWLQVMFAPRAGAGAQPDTDSD